MIASLILFVVAVAISATLLHIAVWMTGGSYKSTTGTAFAASGTAVVACFLCGMIPWLGLPLAVIASVGIIMHFYEVTIGRGVVIIALQTLMSMVLGAVSALLLGGMGMLLF